MAATTTIEGQDRVLATAQQIVKSLNINTKATEDMLLILSSFDNRLSNISDLIENNENTFETAENIILDSSSGNNNIQSYDDYFNAIDIITKLTESLSLDPCSHDSGNTSDIIDRAENALQLGMAKLEDEFLHILVSNTVPLDMDQVYGSIRRGDAIKELKAIADRMIRAGYEKECCQVYSNVRRDVLDECLAILGVERLSIEEVQRIEWKVLDEKMKKWVQAVKVVVKVLLYGEKRLCEQVFSESEAAIGTFVEFENAVKGENSKRALLGGEIHPLTRYVMNYLKLLVDYSDSLNTLLPNSQENDLSKELDDIDSGDTMSPISCRLLSLITSLEANLEEKSRLYDDSALRYIFLMNNILYIVQKVKDSDLRNLLGDRWIRKHRGQIRQWHTSYLRAAWGKAILYLKDDGFSGGSSSASKLVLKERFKNFNACFEDIYRIQSSWKVPDDQLREELRISISEKVLPAYRAFVGRFGSQLESGRHAGKYVKYTPDDLENYLSDLFEGKPAVLNNIKRKGSV
ncbi:hypothetical protein CTI12_AA184920 [Artemisia annua]|uniref:Exocyst subunit Exo70 family protein n=1 Tax=Artemisia annua TaxID=35608 RepID=A0A2U1P7U8_ARTAN|nr:hypothetical protein CTI12_AA184920 [Artemisia annua]